MRELRIEVNIDVIDEDIDNETIREYVEKFLRATAAKEPYCKLQSVLIVKAGKA